VASVDTPRTAAGGTAGEAGVGAVGGVTVG
jgi:hypothetical protein